MNAYYAVKEMEAHEVLVSFGGMAILVDVTSPAMLNMHGAMLRLV